MKSILPTLVLAMLTAAVAPAAGQPVGAVPVIYSSDLHHPPNDPDDHFDLATLFALPELDIRAVILDCGRRQLAQPGEIPLRQMMAITGRRVPWAIGLADPLKAPNDDGRDQPAEFQRGLGLILSVLRAADRPVTIITVGSLRDVAAAFNRDPQLLREKVGRIYVNAGNAAGPQDEYNVTLDPHAFRCVMESGLPIWYCPCFGEGGPSGSACEDPRGGYGTCWTLPQERVFERIRRPLLAYFLFALRPMPAPKQPEAPVHQPAWVDNIDPEWRAQTWAHYRCMWSTASFFHSAGRRIYRVAEDDYQALSAAQARSRRIGASAIVKAFHFEPVRTVFDEAGALTVHDAPVGSPTKIFRAPNRALYSTAMRSVLAHLLGKL
ncbi:MAG: nucleoside hydrolase [Armatimonadetes bacterium]|nr:nucleoside hydrolase [Armatimonadota bacterium]